MKRFQFLAGILAMAALSRAQPTQQPPRYPNYPSETPAKFQPSTSGFDYLRREEMIPMRDGVRLHTIILIPKGARNAPILLTRTPYGAGALTGHAHARTWGRSCRVMTTRWR